MRNEIFFLVSALALSCGTFTQVRADAVSVLADDPVAYYRFNETTGNVAANIGSAGAVINGQHNNFAGAQIGVSGPQGPASGGFEPDNIALLFDGQNNYVQAPNHASLRITGALTVEAWVNINDFSIENQGIVGIWDIATGNNRAYQLLLGGSNYPYSQQPAFAVNSTGASVDNVVVTGGGPLTPGEWYHLVGVFDPGTAVRIYVNGDLSGEITIDVPLSVIV